MSKLIDLTGQRFGRLTVIERAGKTPQGRAKWKCKCDCGKVVNVTGTNLRTGETTSCGCFGVECATARIVGFQTKHSKCATRLYSIWKNMKQRCVNPHNTYYCNYGGRGIKVCSEWEHDFQSFYDWAVAHGYSDNLTIDRIDNDAGYSPTNCQWSTKKHQERNKRRNHMVEINGETKTLAEWCEIYSIAYDKARSCLRYGGSVEDAFGIVPRKK